MRIRGLFLVLAAINTIPALAEAWECKTPYTTWDNVSVIADGKAGQVAGKITVAGVSYDAEFKVEGFDRRWDFGLDEKGRYDYALILQLDGDGLYYKRIEEKDANLALAYKMLCRQKK